MTGEAMQNPVWLSGAALGFTFAVGLVIGSFLNVVIHRLPLGQSIVKPGSHCPSCNTAIKPWDNVPVLSYLWLGGRCRQCRVRISPRYPAVELLTGCVFVAIAWRFGASPATPVLMLFAAGLIAAALIDLDHRIIPDEISLGGLAVGLVLVPAVQAGSGGPLGDALGVAWGGALVGGGVLCRWRSCTRGCRRPWGASSSTGRAKARPTRRRAASTTGSGSRAWASATSSSWR